MPVNVKQATFLKPKHSEVPSHKEESSSPLSLNFVISLLLEGKKRKEEKKKKNPQENITVRHVAKCVITI